MNAIVILCDTLRRDHCGPYHQGRPLNECWSRQAPDWVVPTPNMDRLAARGRPCPDNIHGVNLLPPSSTPPHPPATSPWPDSSARA